MIDCIVVEPETRSRENVFFHWLSNVGELVPKKISLVSNYANINFWMVSRIRWKNAGFVWYFHGQRMECSMVFFWKENHVGIFLKVD